MNSYFLNLESSSQGHLRCTHLSCPRFLHDLFSTLFCYQRSLLWIIQSGFRIRCEGASLSAITRPKTHYLDGNHLLVDGQHYLSLTKATMDESTLRARVPPVSSPSEDNSSTAPTSMFQLRKPQNFRYGPVMELVRLVLFLTFFISFTVMIHTGQYIGAPLYLINQNYYYAWMAFTKQQYAIFLTLLTQWFAPTPVIVSGDASVQGHLRKTADGRLATLFPERVVVMSNHQLYTDWLYLWWIAYTSKMHPYLYIVLKDTFKYLPILGPAMKFYGFIFMSRKWATDQSRMAYRLKKLTASHSGPMSGSAGLDPMWFVMYPEGTNLSGRTRKRSAAWAEKAGLEDMRHLLLPRSTGLFYVLSELKHTIDYVYDITVAYGGIP